MKNVFTIITVFVTLMGFSQNDNTETSITKSEGRLNDLKISVNVDSAEDIEATFKVNDLKDILKDVKEDESLSFEIVCLGEGVKEGTTTSLRYKVEGNSDDVKQFLKSIKKVRKSAINYYNNK